MYQLKIFLFTKQRYNIKYLYKLYGKHAKNDKVGGL